MIGFDADGPSPRALPVALARNYGFGAPELRRLDAIVNERAAFFLEAWYGYFGR